MFTPHRIHRPAVACVLACGLLASTSGVAVAQPETSRHITAAELAGNLAHERTADITPAELAGPLLVGTQGITEQEKQVLASRGVGAPNPVPQAGAAHVESTGTGFDWGSAGIGAATTGALLVLAAGGVGAAYRTRIRVAR